VLHVVLKVHVMVLEVESCVMIDANDALVLLENTNGEPAVVL
jgi:hypothetical protein